MSSLSGSAIRGSREPDDAVLTEDGAGRGEDRLQGARLDLGVDLLPMIEVIANRVVDRRGVEMRIGVEDLPDGLALPIELGNHPDGNPAVPDARAPATDSFRPDDVGVILDGLWYPIDGLTHSWLTPQNEI
jgi:hypothetical protein